MAERFVGERLHPEAGSTDASRLAVGEPGLPRCFTWPGGILEVTGVLRTWRETGPCRHGSGERYVRKHWFEVTTAAGEVVRLYFERQARRGEGKGSRWWLFSVREGKLGAAEGLLGPHVGARPSDWSGRGRRAGGAERPGAGRRTDAGAG